MAATEEGGRSRKAGGSSSRSSNFSRGGGGASSSSSISNSSSSSNSSNSKNSSSSRPGSRSGSRISRGGDVSGSSGDQSRDQDQQQQQQRSRLVQQNSQAEAVLQRPEIEEASSVSSRSRNSAASLDDLQPGQELSETQEKQQQQQQQQQHHGRRQQRLVGRAQVQRQQQQEAAEEIEEGEERDMQQQQQQQDQRQQRSVWTWVGSLLPQVQVQVLRVGKRPPLRRRPWQHHWLAWWKQNVQHYLPLLSLSASPLSSSSVSSLSPLPSTSSSLSSSSSSSALAASSPSSPLVMGFPSYQQLQGLLCTPRRRAIAALLLVVLILFLLWAADDPPADCSLLPSVPLPSSSAFLATRSFTTHLLSSSSSSSSTPSSSLSSSVSSSSSSTVASSRPSSCCGYSDSELRQLLQQPHGFAVGEPRYFYQGRWMTFPYLQFQLDMWKPRTRRRRRRHDARKIRGGQAGEEVEMEEEVPPCVLVSIAEHVPCAAAGQSCVVGFHVRPRTSDLTVVRTHVESRDPPLAELQHESNGRRFRSALNAGANIGVSSVLLAIMFPHMRIVSVEASEENYGVMVLNTRAYPNIVPVHAALWSHPGPLLIVHEDTRSSGFWALQTSLDPPPQLLQQQQQLQLPQEQGARGRTSRTTAATVQATETAAASHGLARAVDVPLLLSLFGLPSFDLMLMDVEGAEMQVFGPAAAATAAVEKKRAAASREGDATSASTDTSSQASAAAAARALGGGPGALTWVDDVQMALVLSHEHLRPGSSEAVLAAFPTDRFLLVLGSGERQGEYVFRNKHAFREDTSSESMPTDHQ